MSEIVVEKFGDNVLFDPNATRLELVPEEAVIQAIEECKRLARKAALVMHPECDDAIVEVTGLERRPGFCHVDVNVRMVPPPKVYLNVKITSEIKHDEEVE
jgi:hypothetical protein